MTWIELNWIKQVTVAQSNAARSLLEMLESRATRTETRQIYGKWLTLLVISCIKTRCRFKGPPYLIFMRLLYKCWLSLVNNRDGYFILKAGFLLINIAKQRLYKQTFTPVLFYIQHHCIFYDYFILELLIRYRFPFICRFFIFSIISKNGLF